MSGDVKSLVFRITEQLNINDDGAIRFLTEKRREHSERLRMIFEDHSDIDENYLDVPRFSYSGGWQVCVLLLQRKRNKNKLTSAFKASALLLMINFVITLSKFAAEPLACGSTLTML